ncbi:MAG: universal stress protein [Candidatus Dormibacterales bacterium]
MFGTIALAIDGSEHSNKGIAVAAELARLAKGKVLVLHVREHDLTKGQVWELETAEAADAIVRNAVDAIKKTGAAAEGDVIRTTHGTVAQALTDSARDHGADTIVMGSRGLSDIAGMVLGSVTHKVIHLTSAMVVVVR